MSLPPPPPPVVTRRHNTRHKKTRSQIEPRRVPGGKQDNPSREACVCSRVQATTNSFFLFLGSPPGFLFTVTVQQGSHSLSLSLSVPLSSSLTVRATPRQLTPRLISMLCMQWMDACHKKQQGQKQGQKHRHNYSATCPHALRKYHCPQEVPQSLLGVTIFSEKLFSHYGLLYFL